MKAMLYSEMVEIVEAAGKVPMSPQQYMDSVKHVEASAWKAFLFAEARRSTDAVEADRAEWAWMLAGRRLEEAKRDLQYVKGLTI